MQRIKEDFLELLERIIPLLGKDVLEIGCGSGERAAQIARKASSVVAIDSDSPSISQAQENNTAANLRYSCESAQTMSFRSKTFDVVLFTLSFHHLPVDAMNSVIAKAVDCTRPGGYIVYLEPTFTGSYFEAELLFDACDGDERAAKARAYYEMLNYKNYYEVVEIDDETIFEIDSTEDFIENLKPGKNRHAIDDFLKKNKFLLTAQRRINIFQVY